MAWQTAVGGFTKEVIIDNEKVWNGDHLVDPSFVPGVIFSNFSLGKIEQTDVYSRILGFITLNIK
jgi:hypothetical protein